MGFTPILATKVAHAAGRSSSWFGSSSIQGRRPSQEDRCFARERMPGGCSFFAVYDGHGGGDGGLDLQQPLHGHDHAS